MGGKRGRLSPESRGTLKRPGRPVPPCAYREAQAGERPAAAVVPASTGRPRGRLKPLRGQGGSPVGDDGLRRTASRDGGAKGWNVPLCLQSTGRESLALSDPPPCSRRRPGKGASPLRSVARGRWSRGARTEGAARRQSGWITHRRRYPSTMLRMVPLPTMWGGLNRKRAAPSPEPPLIFSDDARRPTPRRSPLPSWTGLRRFPGRRPSSTAWSCRDRRSPEASP